MKKRHVAGLAVGGSVLYGMGKLRGAREERARRKKGIDPKEIKPGDILKVDRGLYTHYGIAGKRGTVIEFGHEDRRDRKSLRVARIPYAKFAKDDPVQLEHPLSPYTPDEIIKRAASKIGKNTYGEYSLLNNNCEHFAREAAEGKKHSTQVEENPIGKLYLWKKKK